MAVTPHLDKLDAALRNQKCNDDDRALLTEARLQYGTWIAAMQSLTTAGEERVRRMTELLNAYKDVLEIDLIAKHGCGASEARHQDERSGLRHRQEHPLQILARRRLSARYHGGRVDSPCGSRRRVQGEPRQNDVPGGGRDRGPTEAGVPVCPVLRAERVP